SQIPIGGHAAFADPGEDCEDGLPKRPCRGERAQQPALMGGCLTVKTPLLRLGHQTNLPPPRGEIGIRLQPLNRRTRAPPAPRLGEVKTESPRRDVELPWTHHLLPISRLEPEFILQGHG